MTLEYGAVKTLHLICVGISLSGFCWRAWQVMQGQTIPKPLQRLPHLVDSLLLASGFTLLWLTEFVWLEQTWILIKLSTLPFYILFGALALNYSPPQHRRRYLVLALVAALSMVLLATLKPQ